jgi:CubicO group peptidase (beta-lactamase class C family)
VTTGKNALQLAQESLFATIGIPRAYWGDDALGISIGGSELSLRPQDMARIGYLYLNNGTWDGQQVVSSDWVRESTETRVMRSSYAGYGYQWWTYPDLGAYYGTGLYGQRITVVPEHNLVVVFTGGFVGQASPYYDFLANYIIPAAEDGVSVGLEDSLMVPIIAGMLVVPIIMVVLFVRRRN